MLFRSIKFGLAELDYLDGEYEQALSLYRDLVKRQKNFGETNLIQREFQTMAKLGQYEEASEVIKEHSADILDIDSKYQAGLIISTFILPFFHNLCKKSFCSFFCIFLKDLLNDSMVLHILFLPAHRDRFLQTFPQHFRCDLYFY